nr:hypothetical protein Itr_chr04CG14110 [Ipomoea trifida]
MKTETRARRKKKGEDRRTSQDRSTAACRSPINANLRRSYTNPGRRSGRRRKQMKVADRSHGAPSSAARRARM